MNRQYGIINNKKNSSNTYIIGNQKTGFEHDVYEQLKNSTSYSQFKSLTSSCLLNMNVTHWRYMRLDMPSIDKTKPTEGFKCKQLQVSNADNAFYECEYIQQHSLISNQPIFQSFINSFIDQDYLAGERFSKYKSLIESAKLNGFSEYFNIPINSCAGGRALLTLTSKNTSAETFRGHINKHYRNIVTTALLIDEVGNQQYANYFLTCKKKYDQMIQSKPVELLRIMYECDLSVKAAAKKMGISVDTASKHMTAVRRMLGAKTTHGAMVQATRLHFF